LRDNLKSQIGPDTTFEENMQSKTLPLMLMLTLTLLTILPSSYIGLNRAHAFNQNPAIPNTNLPFGPEADQVIFQYYSDFTTMFNAFTTGGANGIDLTDWPMFASDSGITNQAGSFCDSTLHPDFYCGAANVNFGLFQVDMNHGKSFLGVAQLQSRVPSAISVSLSAGPAGCSTGFGSVSVTLQNQESGVRDQLFAVNNMTLTQVLSGGVLSGSTTLSGTSGTGVYSFPCVVAGTYLLSNSAYANCASTTLASCEVALGSGTTSTAIFHSGWNSGSTQKYTQAGIYLREGIRHLVDKPQFILGQTLLGQAQCSDIYAAQPQGFPNGFCSQVNGVGNKLPADVLNAECSQLAPVDPTLPCSPVDAYLLNETAIGQTSVWWGATGPFADNGYASKQDIRAACDFFVLAGFPVTPSGNTCIDVANAAQGTATKASYPHNTLPAGQQIIFYDRTHHPRRAFGQITIDALNFLFGTANNGAASGGTTCAINYGFKSPAPGCTPAYYGFTEISGIIFADGVNDQTWNLYTGGESFSINPDNEYSTFNSVFASNYCGGAAATVISNYDIVCDPKLDAYTAAGEFADTFSHAVNIFQNATYVSTEDVSANPVYNIVQRFVALNGLNFGNTATSEGSLVNGAGTGWQAGTVGAFSTLLNAHCNPNYTPASSAFACGPNDGTIRRGQSQDSDTFSPYQATSVWDFDVIDMIWDTMLFVNPDTGGPTLQLSNYMVTSHTSSFNPSESSTSPGLGTVVGTTTQIWHLRPDLSFHDGTAVTADDICFTILSYRDMPAALLQASVINVASCTALNSSTVQVKLGLTGPFYDDLVGGVPILPHHVWAAACNWPVGSPEPSPAVLGASQCANPADDPMVPLSGQTTGRMIGSGAYECLGVQGSAAPGVPGGPCSLTASGAPGTSSNTLGGTLLLTAFLQYHRGPLPYDGSKYMKYSWSDKFGTGLVTIADIADAALHNKHYDPYWASPLYSSSPATCSLTGGPGTGSLQCVDIGDISTIALYKGIGAADPIPLGSYVGLDPCINQFVASNPLAPSPCPPAPQGSAYLGSLSSTTISGSSTTTTINAIFFRGSVIVCSTNNWEATILTVTTSTTTTVTGSVPNVDGNGQTTFTITVTYTTTTQRLVEIEYNIVCVNLLTGTGFAAHIEKNF
jgi:Bacterial extracellular solute-binding proteins, family 5 Middle